MAGIIKRATTTIEKNGYCINNLPHKTKDYSISTLPILV